MGARSTLQGAGGLLGAIGGDAANHYLVPGQQPSYRDAAGALADKIGLPRPQSSQERVMGDIGEGLTGTALTMGGGSLLNVGRNVALQGVNRVGQFFTAQPKLQIASTATGAGAAGMSRESGGGQGQQLLAGLAGGLSPGIASTAVAAATRGAIRGTSGATVQRNLNDFAALGTTPSVGQATQRNSMQGIEALLSGGPTSTGVMSRFANKQADDIGNGLQNMADGFYRNASSERAGRAVEKGIDAFSKGMASTRGKLYEAADALIPPQTQVPLTNARTTLANLTTIPKGADATGGSFVNPMIKELAERLEKDLVASRTAGPMGTLAPGAAGIPYETVRAIRTRIGKELADFSLSTDRPTAQLKELYGALSRDIDEVAASQGPAAAMAAKRANDFYRASANRLEQLERVVDKNGGPEKVYNAVMAGTRDGGTTLRAVMQSLPKDGQRAMTGAVIKRMGLANPGMQDATGEAFSAQTFLTNWNKVSPEARKALFDRHGLGFTRDMDRIASVAQNLREGSQVFANPSGSANKVAAYGYATSLVMSLLDPSFATTGSLVAGGIGANVAARAMVHPRFVRWLARSTQWPKGSAVSQINALRNIGEKEKDPELVEIADYLSEQAASNKAEAQP